VQSSNADARPLAAETTAPVAPSRPSLSGRRVSARAVALGLVLVVVNSLWIVDLELLEARTYPSDLALLLNVVTFILVLLAINSFLRAAAPRCALSQAELLVIYAMLAMGTIASSQNTTQALIANIGHVAWFATPENRWETLILPHLRDWLVVKDRAALQGFYLGRSSLYELSHLRAWVPPVLAWMLLWGALMWTSWCAAVLLHRRWIRAERLTFPIAQLVLEVTRPDASLFRRPWLWGGFALACLIEILARLPLVFPSFPGIALIGPELSSLVPAGSAWHAVFPTYVNFYPWVVGLSFLAPLELLFSTWFFVGLRKLEMVGVVGAGMDYGRAWPFVQRQCAGAFLGIGFAALWGARREFAQAVRGRGERAEDALFGQRLAALGVLLGLLVSIVFGYASGMSWWVASCFFAYFLVVGVASARIRAELGPPSNDLVWVGPDNLIPELAGTRVLSPQVLTALSLHHWYNRYYGWIAMPHQADALKLFSASEVRPRRAWGAIVMGAVMLGAVATAWIMLHFLYHRGGMMVPQGIAWQGNESFMPLADRLAVQRPADESMRLAVALGMGLTFVLLGARARFLGFPLHPVGVAMGGVYLSDMMWISVFLAWAAKLAILRYGGRRGFERALPFFLGLVFGQTAMGACWILVGTAFRLPLGRIWR
jgi:hypothetical protein